MKKNTFLLVVASGLVLATQTNFTQAKTASESLNDIATMHLKSMPAVILPAKTRKLMGQDIPAFFAIKDLSDYERNLYAYRVIGHGLTGTSEDILSSNALKELEFFYGSHTAASALTNFLHEATTSFGQAYFNYLLANPTTNIQTLSGRQAIINLLLTNKTLFNQFSSDLAAIKKAETSIISCLVEESVFEKQIFDSAFPVYKKPILKSLNCLNTNVPVQEITVLQRHFSNLAMPVILPAMVAWFAYVGVGKTFSAYTTLALKQDASGFKEAGKTFVDNVKNPSWKAIAWFAALEPLVLWSTYEGTTQYCQLLTFLHVKTNSIATVIRTVKHLAQAADQYPELEKLEHVEKAINIFNAREKSISEDYKKLVHILSTKTFEGEVSLASRKGRVIAAFNLLRKIRNELTPLFVAIGELDAYLACAKLYKKYETQNNCFAFATYLTQGTPSIDAQDLWNPFVGSEKAVANSVTLGGEKPLNVVLTGPNAGGKSTFLKGLTIDIILAQTIGIVPAKKFALTPFAKITTYMNIADDTAGGNSLFKSEVLRAQELMNTIERLGKGQFAFSIMDEMFSGTSPLEGEAATYAVAEDIGSHTNSILLLASHFPKVKELAKVNDHFKNYQVRVEYSDQGTVVYPFKLTEGAADQNVAIDILKDQGFKGSILDKAHKILGK